MKARIRVTSKLEIEVEAEKPIELLAAIGSAQEVFGEEKCGKCGKDNIAYRVREAVQQAGKKQNVYDYAELVCLDPRCRAKFTFGQMEGGKLFPIRFEREGKEYKKTADGKLIPKGSNGWVKFNKETGKEE